MKQLLHLAGSQETDTVSGRRPGTVTVSGRKPGNSYCIWQEARKQLLHLAGSQETFTEFGRKPGNSY
jgi:hypothetical protein